MLQRIAFLLLFFLPVIESFDRNTAFILLLTASIIFLVILTARSTVYFDRLDTLFLAIMVIFSITSITSISPIRSFNEFLRYGAYFSIFIYIRNSPSKDKILNKFFISSIILNSFILSLLALFKSNEFLIHIANTNHLNLFYPNYGHNRLADMLIFAIPLALAMAIFPKYKISWFWVLTSAFFVIMLIYSQGRGVFLSLSASLLIFNYILHKNKRLINKLWQTFSLFFFLISLIFIFINIVYSNFYDISNRNRTISGFYKPISDEKRLEYIKQAIMGFKITPFFGTGLDTFRYISQRFQSKEFSWSWYAHNQFVQIFSETGIIGGLLYSLFFLILISRLYKEVFGNNTVRFHNLRNAIFIILIASIFHSLIDYDWQYHSILLYVFTGFALLVGFDRHKKNISSVLFRFFTFTLIGLFILRIFISLDSKYIEKKLISYNDNMVVSDNLFNIIAVDRANRELYLILARKLYSGKVSWESKHFLYAQYMYLNPYNSEVGIKEDFMIYIDQINKYIEDENINGAMSIISSVNIYFPYYYTAMNGNSYKQSINQALKDKDYYRVYKLLNRFQAEMKNSKNNVYISGQDAKLTTDRIKADYPPVIKLRIL